MDTWHSHDTILYYTILYRHVDTWFFKKGGMETLT